MTVFKKTKNLLPGDWCASAYGNFGVLNTTITPKRHVRVDHCTAVGDENWVFFSEDDCFLILPLSLVDKRVILRNSFSRRLRVGDVFFTYTIPQLFTVKSTLNEEIVVDEGKVFNLSEYVRVLNPKYIQELSQVDPGLGLKL